MLALFEVSACALSRLVRLRASQRHLPRPAQPREPLLAQRLIGQNGHRVGQVQAAGVLPHGDADAALGMGQPELLRQAGGLLSEEQPAAVTESGLGIILRRFGGGQPRLALRSPTKMGAISCMRMN